VRGRGLMLGLALKPARRPGREQDCAPWCRRLLDAGVLALPEGPRGEVLGITPPLVIRPAQLRRAARLVVETWRAVNPAPLS